MEKWQSPLQNALASNRPADDVFPYNGVSRDGAIKYLKNWHIKDDHSEKLKKLLGWGDRDNKRFIFGYGTKDQGVNDQGIPDNPSGINTAVRVPPYAPFLPSDYSEYGDDYQGDVPEYVAYAGNPQPFFPMVSKEEATQYLTNWHINDDYSKHLKTILGWEDRDNKRFIFG